MDEVPYDELDASVVDLCKTLNAMPGIHTVESCGGHPEGEGSLPEQFWDITFQCEVGPDHRPTADAWKALEFLAWFVQGSNSAGRATNLSVSSSLDEWIVPWRRERPEPGESVYFRIDGDRGPDGGNEPDLRAPILAAWWEDYLEVVDGEADV